MNTIVESQTKFENEVMLRLEDGSVVSIQKKKGRLYIVADGPVEVHKLAKGPVKS